MTLKEKELNTLKQKISEAVADYKQLTQQNITIKFFEERGIGEENICWCAIWLKGPEKKEELAGV